MAGIMQLLLEAKGRTGQPALDQSAMQSSTRGMGEDVHRQINGRVVGM